MKSTGNGIELAGAAALALLASAASAIGQSRSRSGNGDCLFAESIIVPLTEQETQDVSYMREEEKLARDVYRAMYNRWQHPSFFNISESEQRHMDAVARLIVRYGLVDPVSADDLGVFTNLTLAELYAKLVEDGSVSLVDAWKAGALIEERDIFDLNAALARTDNPDLERVFSNLARASRNHFRMFARYLADAGESYEAQFLSQDEFDTMGASPTEPGHARGYGPGAARNPQQGACDGSPCCAQHLRKRDGSCGMQQPGVGGNAGSADRRGRGQR